MQRWWRCRPVRCGRQSSPPITPTGSTRSCTSAPAVTLISNHPERDVSPFEDAIETDPEWAKYHRPHWPHDYIGFLEFFFSKCFTEPHSSKQIEDCIGWALRPHPRRSLDTVLGIGLPRQELFTETCARVRCPTLVIHGDEDQIRPLTQGAALAEATGGQLVTLEGAGHIPNARDPVKVNLLLARVRRRTPSGHLGLERVPARAGAARSTSPRRSVSAMRSATSRSPTSCASCTPTSHRLARPAPGHQGARGARRADPSRERRARQRVRPHRVRVGRARPARLPGDPADGRDPGGELHGLPRPRHRPSSTTSGSATRHGSSTTTCTRTPSSRRPRTCG